MANARLRIINSELSGREFALPDHPVIIGRSTSCDVAIPDQSVSRQHVRAELTNGHCVLTDLGSHNGIVVGAATLREAVLAHGDRFELGDIAIEFLSEQEEVSEHAAPPDASPHRTEENALAAVAALPPARPVLVDDLFGPATAPAESGPGEEERAAVAGARGAIKYIGLVIVIIIAGVIAWRMAGGNRQQVDIKPVIVKAGERKVIDLGLRTRTEGAKLVSYVDGNEFYAAALPARDGESTAVFELDNTGFMAIVEGVNPGETDVQLLGERGRRAIVRILVRGDVPRPPGWERLTPEELMARGKLLVDGGKAALNTGHLYPALQSFKEATALLRPVLSTEGNRLRQEADILARKTRALLDEQFEKIKFQALARLHERDRIGAAKAFEELRSIASDPDSEFYQKLTIIFDRTLEQIRQRGG